MKRTFAIAIFTAWMLAPGAVWAQQPPAPASASGAAQQPADPRVGDMLKFCFACHGENGVSRVPSRPTIAGQKADYIARQLRAFKHAAAGRADGIDVPLTRTDPVMDHMAQGLPESLIPKIAAEVSGLPCDGGQEQEQKNLPSAPAVAARCTACHGEDGIGTQAHIPNLAGQQRAYLRRQLLLIRETAWGAEPLPGEAWRSHPIMESLAARLTIKDVDVLAKHFSQLNCRGATPR